MRNAIRNRAMLLMMCLLAAALGTGQASLGGSLAAGNDRRALRPKDVGDPRETYMGVRQGVAPNVPLPQDRTLPLGFGVDVFRNDVTNQLTLALRGGLTSTLLSGREVLGPTVHLFVYSDEETAERDTLHEGAGNLFFGEATLGRKVSTKGGLSREDFVLERRRDETMVARAFEPGAIIVSVPSASEAVVRLIVDPDKILQESAEAESAETTQQGESLEPAITMLWAPRPNPARDGVTFRFSVSRRLPASLDVFDVQGRHVGTVVRGILEPGPRELSWGADLRGTRAKDGVYFVRFEAEGRRFTRRFVMLQ